jgi:hypothetical protein
MAQIHQTATADGKALTLERVVVTPSETLAYISGLRYEDPVYSHSVLTVRGKIYDAYAAEAVGGVSDDGAGLFCQLCFSVENKRAGRNRPVTALECTRERGQLCQAYLSSARAEEGSDSGCYPLMQCSAAYGIR